VHWDFAYRTDEESFHDRLDLVHQTIDAPYRLKLLGRLGLEGPKKLSGRVTQRRQMALLALLAAHEAPLSRDKLIGLLWPETGTDRARHLLSDSVYIIRKELGETATVASAEGVSLNSAVVGSDLADFRSAIANQSYEEALASYGGSFLDGFFPDESEPYERWMRDRREALQSEATRAAWKLVDRAEAAGEVHEAIRWAQRGLKIVPEDERGVRRLIRLHDARGDHAGAVRAYEEFATWLETELDVHPSEKTQTLITDIRERRVPGSADVLSQETAHSAEAVNGTPTGSRARPVVWIASAVAVVVLVTWLYTPRPEDSFSPATSDAPPAVAVLPFEVNDPDLDIWREGMVDLLGTNLDGVADLRTISSRTVLARWREAVGESRTADLQTVLAIGRRAGARYVLVGNAVAIGSGVRLGVELYDADSEVELGRAQVEGSIEEVFALVDELSIAILQSLMNDRPGAIPRVNLARLTTSSLPALKSYLEGEFLFRQGDFEAAIPAYQHAVEIDSTFALAFHRLGSSFEWAATGTQDHDLITEAVGRAARLAHRLPDREALFVRANLWLSRQVLDGLEPLRVAVRRYPDDPEAWYLLGETYFHFGDQGLVPPGEIDRAFAQAIALDPGSVVSYMHRVDMAFRFDPDSARVSVLIDSLARLAPNTRVVRERFLAHDLAFGNDAAQAHAFAGLDTTSVSPALMSYWVLGHSRFLVTQAEVLGIPQLADDSLAQVFLSYNQINRGLVGSALETMDQPAFPEDERLGGYYYNHMRGLPISTARMEREFTSAAIDSSNVVSLFFAGAYATELGADDDRATVVERLQRNTQRSLREGDSLNARQARAAAVALDGFAAWKRGDRAEARDLLETARLEFTGYRGPATANATIRWWLGELSLELRQPNDAQRYFASFWQDPLAAYRLGRIYEQVEAWDKAGESYEYFLEAWKDPDPELQPMVEEARQAIIRLTGLRRE
jgi:DNA-binding SARP family transcriptional activator/TolB-like protein